MATHSPFKKIDGELQVVFAEVYAPNRPDSQGDYATAETIRLMAWKFLASGQTKNVDINHDNQVCGAIIVESFIARDNDPDFIPGSWVVGVHIPDPVQWAMVKAGELNGFSMEGDSLKESRTLSLTVPDWIIGETSIDRGHSHTFVVRYGPSGEFLGGETKVTDGHQHQIVRGTVTEEADGHTHRFSYVEQLDATD